MNTPEGAGNALRAAEAILAEAQRGAEIMRRVRSCLLDYRTAAESFELAGLLHAVVNKASAAAASGGVSIVCEGAERPTDVRADSILVGQVLLNLLYNALDAIRETKRGGGTIRISSCIRSDGFAEISVSDDGVGLSKAMAERIFEPAVTTKREGSGIGLTISRSIIEAHGGRLWAEPNQSCGTTFKFTLPAAAAA
jgi:two-component system sensor kinase FixL